MRRRLCVLASNISVGALAASRAEGVAADAYAAVTGAVDEDVQDDAVGEQA
jgi:hypothetical protein